MARNNDHEERVVISPAESRFWLQFRQIRRHVRRIERLYFLIAVGLLSLFFLATGIMTAINAGSSQEIQNGVHVRAQVVQSQPLNDGFSLWVTYEANGQTLRARVMLYNGAHTPPKTIEVTYARHRPSEIEIAGQATDSYSGAVALLLLAVVTATVDFALYVRRRGSDGKGL